MTARAIPLARSTAWPVLPFALPIGLSAFLLFTVEPLVGRLVLPVFGGTPGVWTTTLCFFQAVLLCGYLYGHISATRFGRLGPPIHLAIASLGFVALIIGPSRVGDLRVEAIPPSLDLLRILVLLVGLPAFVLTTTTPLVSAWYGAARSAARGEDGGTSDDPYWLYALSNAGSLLALLAYPLLIEPAFGLGAQRGIWAAGYALLVIGLAVAGSRALPWLVGRTADRERELAIDPKPTLAPLVSPTTPAAASGTAVAAPIPAADARAAAIATPAIDWPRRLRWLLMAAVPSGLLSAVTTFIATDLVSAPLLWVVPLAIYLTSFIIAFSPRGSRLVAGAVVAAPAMITLLWVPYGSAGGWPIVAILAVELVAFGIVATALHGRLAADRPDPSHLTEFYLVLSTGGALASAFVAIVAPQVFPDIWEYPILLVLGLVALALVVPAAPIRRRKGARLDFRPLVAGFWRRMTPYLIGAGILASILLWSQSPVTELGIRWLIVGGLILAVGARPWFLAISTAGVLLLATFVLQPPVVFRERSFFGVTEVLRPGDGKVAILFNGTTVHGTQWTDPAKQDIPTTYYGRETPIGDVFRLTDASLTSPTVGIVGLGAGTLAAYDTPTTHLTYFEIDPVVIQVASDPRLFTYLAHAPLPPRIVLGDARLSLAKEPDGTYDLLVMDAFSSDAIPIHLLTAEAVQDELRTLAPDGLIAFHISNRYYDLSPAISAALHEAGLTTLERTTKKSDTEADEMAIPSRWLAASRDPAKLNALYAMGWTDTQPADHPFTDDYADLLAYLHIAP